MQTITESKRPRNWTRRKINAELKARNLRQADIVRRTGRSQGMVSEVVAGRRKSWPIALEIAAALGRQPHEIWPRIYPPPSPESLPDDDQRCLCTDLRDGRRHCAGERRQCRRRVGDQGQRGGAAKGTPASIPSPT